MRLPRCDTSQTERPWPSCPRRFGHSGAASSRWGLCPFLRFRCRQHHPRASFAESTCRAVRIEAEDYRPDSDPPKTCSGTPSWFPAVWPIATRHPSRSDTDAGRPSGRYLTAGPMVRIRFPPAKSAANPESLDQAVLISGGPQVKRRRVPAPGPDRPHVIASDDRAAAPKSKQLRAPWTEHAGARRRAARHWGYP
jgi:hypothetical protein